MSQRLNWKKSQEPYYYHRIPEEKIPEIQEWSIKKFRIIFLESQFVQFFHIKS